MLVIRASEHQRHHMSRFFFLVDFDCFLHLWVIEFGYSEVSWVFLPQFHPFFALYSFIRDRTIVTDRNDKKCFALQEHLFLRLWHFHYNQLHQNLSEIFLSRRSLYCWYTLHFHGDRRESRWGQSYSRYCVSERFFCIFRHYTEKDRRVLSGEHSDHIHLHWHNEKEMPKNWISKKG